MLRSTYGKHNKYVMNPNLRQRKGKRCHRKTHVGGKLVLNMRSGRRNE